MWNISLKVKTPIHQYQDPNKVKTHLILYFDEATYVVVISFVSWAFNLSRQQTFRLYQRKKIIEQNFKIIDVFGRILFLFVEHNGLLGPPSDTQYTLYPLSKGGGGGGRVFFPKYHQHKTSKIL